MSSFVEKISWSSCGTRIMIMRNIRCLDDNIGLDEGSTEGSDVSWTFCIGFIDEFQHELTLSAQGG
jgi:hypothetical protein